MSELGLQPADAGSAIAAELAAFFHRNGYVRRQDPYRIAAEGWRRYKKGVEIRLTANSEAELTRIRELLVAGGFKPGKPYAQGASQYRQPVYGGEQVKRFLEMIGAVPQDARPALRPDERRR
jgi:hypothetical protein